MRREGERNSQIRAKQCQRKDLGKFCQGKSVVARAWEFDKVIIDKVFLRFQTNAFLQAYHNISPIEPTSKFLQTPLFIVECPSLT